MKNIISVISYYKWVFERDIHEEILSVEDTEKEESKLFNNSNNTKKADY